MDGQEPQGELSSEERKRLAAWKAKVGHVEMHEQLTTDEQKRLGFLRWLIRKGKVKA